MPPIVGALVFIAFGLTLIVFHRRIGDRFRSRPGAVPAPRWLYLAGLFGAGVVGLGIGIWVIVNDVT